MNPQLKRKVVSTSQIQAKLLIINKLYQLRLKCRQMKSLRENYLKLMKNKKDKNYKLNKTKQILNKDIILHMKVFKWIFKIQREINMKQKSKILMIK